MSNIEKGKQKINQFFLMRSGFLENTELHLPLGIRKNQAPCLHFLKVPYTGKSFLETTSVYNAISTLITGLTQNHPKNSPDLLIQDSAPLVFSAQKTEKHGYACHIFPQRNKKHGFAVCCTFRAKSGKARLCMSHFPAKKQKARLCCVLYFPRKKRKNTALTHVLFSRKEINKHGSDQHSIFSRFYK